MCLSTAKKTRASKKTCELVYFHGFGFLVPQLVLKTEHQIKLNKDDEYVRLHGSGSQIVIRK